MTNTRAGLSAGDILKRYGWPLGIFAGAALAIGIGIGLGVVGTSATAVGGDAAKLQAPPPPTPRSAGLAGAFLAGRHAEASSDAGTAVNFYNRVNELDPENFSLLQNTYFLAAQAGDFATAIPAARKAAETAPRRGMAPVILGIDHYKKKEYDQALTYLEHTTGQSMNGFAMPILRAWALAPSQLVEKALQELELFKAFQDTGDIYYLMHGLLNEFYGRSEQALANYDVIAANIENQRFSTLRLVAEGYHRLGKDAALDGLFERFMKTHGASPTFEAYMASVQKTPVRKVTAEEGMAEGLFLAAELLLMNDPNEVRAQVATAYAQTALYLNPDLDIARRFIGSTLAARGRFAESNAVLAVLKKSTPGYLDIQIQISENLLRMQQPNDALKILEDILKERPNWTDAHVARGDILRQEKKYGEAAASYSNALKFTSAERPENWAIYYSRGIAYDRDKNWDAAEKDFKKALELRPNDPSVLNYLGYSYLDRGVKLSEARTLIEGAYKQRPNDGYIIDSFGWAQYMNGEYEEAVLSLEKAVEASPSDGTINEHLGDAYWKVGRRNEARFQWQRALSFEIEEPQRANILKKLESGLAQN
jgi:Flp pilus assembly protein TadD